jgi:hypothetical protein
MCCTHRTVCARGIACHAAPACTACRLIILQQHNDVRWLCNALWQRVSSHNSLLPTSFPSDCSDYHALLPPCCRQPQMAASSRAWAGLSHQAVVHAVCVDRLQLAFPADAPDAVVMLGEACLAFEPRDRPSFQDIVDILMPLSEVLQCSN